MVQAAIAYAPITINYFELAFSKETKQMSDSHRMQTEEWAAKLSGPFSY